MKADGPRLDGAATSAGLEEGRAGGCFICAEGGWWAGQFKKFSYRRLREAYSHYSVCSLFFQYKIAILDWSGKSAIYQ